MVAPRRARRTGPNRGGRRNDPAPRHIDGSVGWTKVKNEDPNKKYCWVFMGNSDQGVDYYSNLGWTPVKREKGNASSAKGITGKTGDVQVMMGHMLMSIPKDVHQEIYDYGEDGSTGQALADRREDMMIDAKNANDDFRGLSGSARGLRFGQNGTTALEEER